MARRLVIIGGDAAYEWTDKLDWTILRIEKAFAPFSANEIWYCPPVQDPLPEPKLPPKDTLLYIAKRYSMAATVKFITSSDRNSNLL